MQLLKIQNEFILNIRQSITECVVSVLRGAYRATKYVSPKLTIKVTRVGKPDRRDRQDEFRLTVGKPNYLERKFIRDCKAVNEPFPVSRVQLKFKDNAHA